jgi:tRNA(His) guanylyltransferase
MSNKLHDRISSYQAAADTKLLPRVPIVISINGRSFSKLTSLLDKPYDQKFAECILNTMLRLCTDVEGALFAYQHNDEIVVIARNDQGTETAPWYDNRAQKIASITSSIATLHFNRCATAIDLNLMGEAIFSSQVFVVPNIMEAINTLVYKQQYNFQTSIQAACFYELLKKYDKNTIKEMLNGLSLDERIDLLEQESQVDFHQYSIVFRRGAACYKVPKVSENGIMKNKWFINPDLPIFTKDQSFLTNIFRNGADIFRQESF